MKYYSEQNVGLSIRITTKCLNFEKSNLFQIIFRTIFLSQVFAAGISGSISFIKTLLERLELLFFKIIT